MNQAPRVLISELVFPEAPRWHQDRLWFTDILSGRVISSDADGGHEVIVRSDDWLNGLGWTPEGDLLAVAMQGRKLLKLTGGALVEVADLSAFAPGLTNDMAVDSQGRAYIGELGFNFLGGEPFKGGNLIMVAPGAEPRIVATDLAMPNGIVITPDGKTMIVAETLGDCLTAFDILPDGSLTNRRIWASTPGKGPDGICLDPHGAIWAGFAFAKWFMRVDQGGNVTHGFETNNLAVACALGGKDGNDLYLCRASEPAEAMATNSGGSISVVSIV